jgi:hypothetical protein
VRGAGSGVSVWMLLTVGEMRNALLINRRITIILLCGMEAAVVSGWRASAAVGWLAAAINIPEEEISWQVLKN